MQLGIAPFSALVVLAFAVGSPGIADSAGELSAAARPQIDADETVGGYDGDCLIPKYHQFARRRAAEAADAFRWPGWVPEKQIAVRERDGDTPPVLCKCRDGGGESSAAVLLAIVRPAADEGTPGGEESPGLEGQWAGGTLVASTPGPGRPERVA